MNLPKVLGFGLAVLLMLSGCGGNNSDTPAAASDVNGSVVKPPEGNVTNPAVTVVLPVSSTVLTTNSQVVTIDVRVFDSANNPYSEGEVKLINSPDALSGRDVGTFDKYSSKLVNGIATFTYTAPSKLDVNTENIYFGFYHDSDPAKIKQYTMSIVPESNQVVISSYKLVESNSGDVKVDLNATKSISYSVYDSNDDKLLDKDIKSLTVTSLNPSLGTLSDSYGNKRLSQLSIANKNTITVNVDTNTKSGLIPIKVDANFIDANGDEQNLTKIYSVVVLSGPPTAFSLSYAGTSQDEARAKFIEHWVLTVTDKYNNLVNTKPTLSTGMLAGYAQSSATTAPNAGNYLFGNTTVGGTIVNGTNGAADEFRILSNAFNNIDFDHDYLVTYGNGYTYDASGKWDITQNSANILNLNEEYNGKDVTNIGYAVGHNYRQDTCRDGEEWVGNVYPQNNNYILDSNASAILDVEYDYYMVGKAVMLWVNLTGSANGKITKVGESRKVTLRGVSLTGESVSIAKGFQGVIRLNVHTDKTPEYYRNANFAFHVEVTADDTPWEISDTSMIHGITDCYYNGGVAYVDVNITAPAGGAGSVSLTNVLVSGEF